MNKLIIDTTNKDKTIVKIQMGEAVDTLIEENIPKSQNTLKLIDKILRKISLSLKTLMR